MALSSRRSFQLYNQVACRHALHGRNVVGPNVEHSTLNEAND
jgi:hypothetical protein